MIDRAPSSWLLDNADLIVHGATALDVACGTGRHALFLASTGCRVRAIDHDARKLDELRATAAGLGLDLSTAVVDLEAADVELGAAAFELIVVVHYLHRPLFPALIRALAPGGVMLYETFTVHQAARGKPTNPDFLLEPGELRTLVAPLRIVREREGDFENRMVSSIVAKRT